MPTSWSGARDGYLTPGGPGGGDSFDVARTGHGDLTVAGDRAFGSGWVVELSEFDLASPTDRAVGITGEAG